MTPLCEVIGMRRCVMPNDVCCWTGEGAEWWQVMVADDGTAYTYCFYSGPGGPGELLESELP